MTKDKYKYVEGLLRNYKKNKSRIKILELGLVTDDDYTLSAIDYSKDKIQTSNKSDLSDAVVKREKEISAFNGVAEFNQKRMIVDGKVAGKFPAGSYIRISDGKNSYRYVVAKAEETGDKTSVLLTEKVSAKLIEALAAAKEAKAVLVKNGALVGDTSRLEALGLTGIDELKTNWNKLLSLASWIVINDLSLELNSTPLVPITPLPYTFKEPERLYLLGYR